MPTAAANTRNSRESFSQSYDCNLSNEKTVTSDLTWDHSSCQMVTRTTQIWGNGVRKGGDAIRTHLFVFLHSLSAIFPCVRALS